MLKPWSAKTVELAIAAETARPEKRDVVLPLRPQDLADLRAQRVDVVADAAFAELSEAGEVAPDLRRVDVRVLADLLRGDPLLPHLLRLREHPQVLAQARGDPDRQTVAVTGLLDAFEQGSEACSPLVATLPGALSTPTN